LYYFLLSISVRYELSQDPYLLTTGSIHCSNPSIITLSPDGRSVAIGGDNSIGVYNAASGAEEEVLKHIHDGMYTVKPVLRGPLGERKSGLIRQLTP
jgi:hypothetical protein